MSVEMALIIGLIKAPKKKAAIIIHKANHRHHVVLASAFTDQLRIDRESFKRTLAEAYNDEKIEPGEQEHIIAEAERLHLSDTEFELLLLEAKEDYEKSKAVQELSFGHLLLDPTTHPEFAAEQFRILVAQLRLLSKAVAHAPIVETLSAKETSDELTIKIAQLVADYGKH
jgi:type II secretory pathway predicted ATPase ExeA